MTPPFLFCPFVRPFVCPFVWRRGPLPRCPVSGGESFPQFLKGLWNVGFLPAASSFCLPPGKFTTFAKNSSGTAPDFCTKTVKTSIFCGYIYTLHRVFLQKRVFPAKLTESSQEDNRFFASIGYCISTGNGAATVTLEHDSSSHQNDTPKPPPVTASRWG